jgi:hypothetical protein
MAEGLIYPFDRERYVVSELPKAGRYYISVDYGTRNPFSAGLWCISGGTAFRMREYYHDGRARNQILTDEEYYTHLQKLARGVKVEQIVIDPSAASMIAVIRRWGEFSVRKAKNEVLPGIRLVTSLLQENLLKIGSECADAIREFGLYCWENAEQKDRPKKEHDHAMDDIRYFCATVLRRNQEIQKKLGGMIHEELADRALSAHVGQTDGSGR